MFPFCIVIEKENEKGKKVNVAKYRFIKTHTFVNNLLSYDKTRF